MRQWRGLVRALALPLVAGLALVCFSTAVNELNSGQQTEQLEQMEAAIRRCCAACYATEGVYPPDLAYLQEHYGLQLDTTRYIVHYAVTAQNLMPDVVVLPKT